MRDLEENLPDLTSGDMPNAKKSQGFRVGRYFKSIPVIGAAKDGKEPECIPYANEASEHTLDGDSNSNSYKFHFNVIFFNPTQSKDVENQFRTTQSVIHGAAQSLTQPRGV